MDLQDLITELDAGRVIPGGSPLHAVMHQASQDAMRITAELNGRYHEPHEVRALLSRLTGRTVPETMTLFPPFTADFGRNITFGNHVFVNSGCRFQDQGGITIGDDALIGHNTVLATLDHDINPVRRTDMHPAPIAIGRNVWIGSNATVLKGVTIGEDGVVAAGSVVTTDVPQGAVVAGVPARVVRSARD